ncbi:hypothetical protein F4809DRAFT_634583 [Biscogniauxia mediterranea]|nr:hypothetical protein F4809DRAFT_634583 [Biscogniauxia mediterranea]
MFLRPFGVFIPCNCLGVNAKDAGNVGQSADRLPGNSCITSESTHSLRNVVGVRKGETCQQDCLALNTLDCPIASHLALRVVIIGILILPSLITYAC